VGICVPLSPTSQAEGAGNEWYDSGIGFAVPLHGNDKVIAALKEGKTLQKGFLGVQTKAAGSPPMGANIVQTLPGSAAEKCGLAKDDKILEIDGAEILDPPHLATILARYVAGDKVKVTIQRGGEKKTLEAELAVAPPPSPPGKPNSPSPAPPGGKPEEPKN
jgi:serine protease Do